MKISLAWLFDHIDGDLSKVDVPALVQLFNLKVAEIEKFEKTTIDSSLFTVARVVKIDQVVQLFSPELGQEIQISLRSDAQIDNFYLLKKVADIWEWASGRDFNSLKDGLLPALYFISDDQAIKWHDNIELYDYILEVDNKSLTHRPDMWGHRGFAREIALLLDLKLRSEDDLLVQIPVKEYSNKFACDTKNSISIAIQSDKCIRFAGLYVDQVVNLPSQLWMAIRLFRVDMRGINNLVDISNYVMLDLGQPMHVFDANLLTKNELVVRQAKIGEGLELLTGEFLELNSEDLIVADGTRPVSLAGIKGGATSGTSIHTCSIVLEAANFDAATIRRSAARYKIRTESSARFEKTLDPNQNVAAIERFIKLLKYTNPELVISNEIVSLGFKNEPKKIILAHEFIEKRLGIKIASDFVIDTLSKLGFVIIAQDSDYVVEVPSWRSCKDVNIAEDLVEEVGRIFGYDNIIPCLPSKITQPGNLDPVFKIRQIKQYLASAAGMHEVENYPFYDEDFLQVIKWQPQCAVEVKNPVSENWRRLVTSLVPHLCKNVQQNSHDLSVLRYFEWGRIWYPNGANAALELRILSGIIFNKEDVDFYVIKNYLVTLFQALHLDIVWQKPQSQLATWWHPYQTATLLNNGKQIGHAGLLSESWMDNIAQGSAFAFEIDGDFLLTSQTAVVKYQPPSRYQSIHLDISLFVPLIVTVADLQESIEQSDERIYQVELVDSFKKDDWLDKKSLTFRYYFADKNKTLSNDEIMALQKKVVAGIQKNGVSVR